MKSKQVPIPLSRIEAFSDGVIAIIITIMILEIKIPTIDNTATSDIIWAKVYAMFQPFIAYLLSFVMNRSFMGKPSPVFKTIKACWP